MKIFFKKNITEILIFSILFSFFLTWYILNFSTISNNNDPLEKAIQIYNYKPLISYLIDNIFYSNTLKKILGFIFFPALVGVMLFKIFFKILNQKLWAISLMMLSLFSTENFPFYKFIIKFLTLSNYDQFINKYENFEIMGFPIPSFSTLYFLILFYLTYKFISLDKKFLYVSTFFWVITVHIHPIDGLIGAIYWTSFIFIFSLLKKIIFTKTELFIIFIFYIANFSILFLSLDPNVLNISTKQSLPFYNLFFYFFAPAIIMAIMFKNYKIDKFEFFIKFFSIYLLMATELFLILLSFYGFGIELQMLENRITLFLLHYLYYIPIIYYLGKDNIYYEKSREKRKVIKLVKLFFYYIFNKYKIFYLLPFSILLVIYAFNSLKL